MVDLEGLKSMHKHECWAARLVADPNIEAAVDVVKAGLLEVLADRPGLDGLAQRLGEQAVAAAHTPQGDTEQ